MPSVLIALHVADDSFFQPEAGTDAGDHLVSGLMPMALLGLAAWGCLRLRPGLRATIALVVGLFGVVVGIEAVYYTTKGGPSGDDVTGFLAMGSGVALIALGALILWRTRRRDAQPAEYERRVMGFLDEALLQPREEE